MTQQQAAGEIPPSRTAALLSEIRDELAAYRNFDTGTREGIGAYLDVVREPPERIDAFLRDAWADERILSPDPVLLEMRPTTARTAPVWTFHRRWWSRLNYRKAPGRSICYLVYYDGRIVGIVGLSSPVMSMGPRDRFLTEKPSRLPGFRTARGKALRGVLDMSTCVGVQPWASLHNGGKLLAALATSSDVAEHYRKKYGQKLRWIVTTSVYGESVQYDRLYKFLGLTKGYGHMHVAQATFDKMMAWMRESGKEIPGDRFGDGINARMRKISAFLKESGLGSKFDLRHGQRRGVYIHEVQRLTAAEIFAWWYERWCPVGSGKYASTHAENKRLEEARRASGRTKLRKAVEQ